ncbi:transcription-repair coupling factor [Vagococcus xieshaowenii]|uniref:Transcription-repair-coupling factor n=1 Tax=Vagococcus xieshaowenii TaxID=2562451 RepID=A0AAJ5EDS7_9ENTE|nr:transcription-repair coupling factor [Vagococcus xieshaowenii]QCA28023.1 transcription-repair coupling factor [Vagococcus xieshaowenii]TFZ40301.1 transcription-repair coupling factor [Vagococcus xieshaowenii]
MALLEKILASSKIRQWVERTNEPGNQLLVGLTNSAKTLAMAALYEKKKNKTVIVVPNVYQMGLVLEDLRHLFPDEQLFSFPIDEVTSAEMSIVSPEVMAEKIQALSFLASEKSGILVVPTAGFRRYLPAKTTWLSYEQTISVGMDIELPTFIEKLVLMGYRREGMITKPGEFSIRGSIIDIYPLTNANPYRIDLFDTEIDSLRMFDVETQRSLENITSFTLTPAVDVVVTNDELAHASESLRKKVLKQATVMTNPDDKGLFMAYFDEMATEWAQGYPTETIRQWLDLIYQEKLTLLDYLNPNDCLIFDDYARILEVEKELLVEEAEWQAMKLQEVRMLTDISFGKDIRQLVKQEIVSQSFLSLFQKGMGRMSFKEVVAFECRAMQQFFGQMPLLKEEVANWHKKKETVLILASDEEKSQKLLEMMEDYDIPVVVQHTGEIIEAQTQIRLGSLQNGFEWIDEKLVVVTEKELLKTVKRKRARRQTISNAERLRSYNELKVGDYVVHVNHGIGKYVGMETLVSGGVHQDYISILYQNNDKLFIPVTQLELIQKYVASESKTPKINKLGGSEWTKTKRKVAGKVEDIADDLIKLYAAREAERGFAFSPDDSLQKEFEDAFPYSETEDQLRSIQEIKKDMEKEKPMDRLLVGDVGYGKTEVAIRAAFKAVRDDKQVAILVPTTVLAQQHYETLVDRFRDFPVRVGLLSRFRSKKQQEETIEQLKKGQLDIVVGTHRVLSSDIEFQDLGLLVIDEEQRFGVKHKERLKQLRKQVDVLTLTATPIPRTLHMSMLGVRDLSVIETPPSNRYPVQTYVMEENFGAIRDGIEREMSRGGQVFYLHNRVDTIEQKVAELQALVPDARVAHAHGQMTEVQLENVLMDFIAGAYDVLVTTTIIETGIDIPNANTLFVENADHMGLSQLYQLRGRVGRSNRVAYAYFMHAPQKILSEVGEKRLQAIKDFTELGSGFKIAMRDLSIRGAGNLLGAQQHGFIDTVGFDLYSQMLEEAVARKQGKDTSEYRTSVEIDLELNAYLPETYISDERQKIEIYKRVRQLESREMYEELEGDLIDRFGEFPDEVVYLLTVGRIKMDGDRALIDSIRKTAQRLTIRLSKVGSKTYMVEDLFKALSATTLKSDMGQDGEHMVITLTIPNQMIEEIWLKELAKFVEALRKQRLTKTIST